MRPGPVCPSAGDSKVEQYCQKTRGAPAGRSQVSAARVSATAPVAGAVAGSTQAADDVLASTHADISIAQNLPGVAGAANRSLENLPTNRTGQTVQGALAGLGSKTNGIGELSGSIGRATGNLGQNLGGQINNALGGLTGRMGSAR